MHLRNNMDLILKNETKVVDIENDESFSISGNDSNLTINVKDLKHITIIEKDSFNINITLNVSNNASCIYQILSDNTEIKRNINIGSDSSFNMTSVSLNKVKDNTTININGKHSSVNVRYLSVASSSKQDIYTTINHYKEESKSSINNVGVVLDNADILFNTIGYVLNGVPGCDCRQLSRGLIVGDNSTIVSKPILLIDEYDVKAYHGASIGKMSDEELFYLMSRGLSKNDAFMLILNGLIVPIISDFRDENLKSVIDQKIKNIIG